MVRKYQTSLWGHSVVQPRNGRASSDAGKLRLLTTERAVAGTLRQSADREARRASAAEFWWSSVIAFALCCMHTARILMLFIRLYVYSVSLSRLQAWFEIRYTLDSLLLGNGTESIPTFRLNVVVSFSMVGTTGSDHTVTQGRVNRTAQFSATPLRKSQNLQAINSQRTLCYSQNYWQCFPYIMFQISSVYDLRPN